MKLMRSFLLVVFTLFPAAGVFAQGASGTINGTVRDSTGAVVPGSTVTAIEIETNVAHKTVANAQGEYSFPLLPIGSYTLKVDAPTFRSYVRSGLTLNIDQHEEIPVVLEPGASSETVSVDANSQQLETEQHSNGTVISAEKITQLPLNSRNFYSLALLVPGVMPPASNSYLGYRGGFNVAGATESSNNFTLDGFDDNNEQLNNPAFRPSVDAIGQFKILTGLYNAEYGRDAGGQVIVTGRSGSNPFHGLAYEYLRNQVLDARNFFAPAGLTPAYKRSQFGGTFSGPIVRNRTFFFFNYEGLRLHQQLFVKTTVPTATMLAGNFSGISTQLTDPSTGLAIPGNNLTLTSQWGTEASTIGRALAAYYPGPNTAGSQNYTFSPLRPEDSNQYGGRVDQTFSQKDSLYAEYNYYNDTSTEPYNTLCGTRTVPGFGCFSSLTFMLAGISETHVFSPSVLNSIHLSWNRYQQVRNQMDGSINFNGTYNIPNVFYNPGSNNLGLPQVAVTGYATLGGPSNNPQNIVNNEYQVTDQVIWTHKAHTTTFGLDIRRNKENVLSILTGRGAYTYTASTSAPTTGNAMADLLLGLPTTSSNNPYAPKIYVFTTAFDGYAQDDWKITPRLTLNYGMRWELNTPFTAANNGQSTFSPSQLAVVQAGTGGYGPNLIQYDFTKFQPRVGFSYSVTPKTVIHGGFGLYTNAPASFAGIGNLFYNPPMRKPQTFNSSGLHVGTHYLINALTLQMSNPFPTTLAGSSSAPYGINYGFLNPYVEQFGANIQQQLSTNILLDVGYFGSIGLHLPNQININQPVTGGATRPYAAYSTSNIVWYESEAYSNFHSLQVKLEKRFTHGSSLLVSYAYSKSLDDSPGFNGSNASNSQPQNSYNLAAEYGPSDFDIRNRIVISGVYQSPFGRDGRWVKTGIGGALLGGWQLSGIYSGNSGRPFTVYYSTNVSLTGNFHDRPNLIGNVNNGLRTVSSWFNTAALQQPVSGQFGNMKRNSVVGPGLQDVDMTLARNFHLYERLNLEGRAEYFNLANHPIFDLPGTTIAGSGYNQVSATATDQRELQLALRLSF
jgi:hypothetical protein